MDISGVIDGLMVGTLVFLCAALVCLGSAIAIAFIKASQ